MIPAALTKQQISIVYANKADVLNSRRAEKARIFPDRREPAQVADIYHPRSKGHA